ncbi:MAG: A/G-specific adenine glycosylase [Proteobacteria bacterium]|nr:A/G-specific adenine glycosylase [Pseudomonadota bacterium]
MVASKIVGHFRCAKRDLPWRRTRDPYAIWISEVMLQQTRVATAIPYYQRWLARFPTVRDLAGASLDDVLAAWSGLGYYSRARNLHRCARELVANHRGSLPESARALVELPGIGRYTAGAIASIAFGHREPVVDGNVARVLARIYELEHDVKSTAGMRALWDLADDLVPADAPGDFNQGLMELGATVCTPTRPSCPICPVRGLCSARASGRQETLPVMPSRKRASQLPLIDSNALWIERGNRLLLARRGLGGLYGGLWELPQTDDLGQLEALLPAPIHFLPPDHSPSRQGRDGRDPPPRRRQLRSGLEPVLEHRQVLSHRQLRIRVYRAEIRGLVGKTSELRYSKPSRANERDGSDRAGDYNDDARYDAFAWHTRSSLAKCGLSAATRSIIDRLEEMYGWSKNEKRSTSSPKDTKRSSPA